MTELANRDALLGATLRRFTETTLPIRGIAVRIQSLTEYEQVRWRSASLKSNGEPNKERMMDAPRRMIIACVVDGAGNRLLTDSDVGALLQWDSADVDHLAKECMKHCGLGDTPDELDRKNECAPAS